MLLSSCSVPALKLRENSLLPIGLSHAATTAAVCRCPLCTLCNQTNKKTTHRISVANVLDGWRSQMPMRPSLRQLRT